MENVGKKKVYFIFQNEVVLICIWALTQTSETFNMISEEVQAFEILL